MASLGGRRVALVGLEREQMFDVTAVLDQQGAEWQAFSTPDVAAVSHADLVIAGAAALPMIAGVPRPVLIIATAHVVTDAAFEGSAPRDFCIAPPLRAEELAFRASHLLDHVAATPLRGTAMPVVLAADDDPTTTAIVRAVVTRNSMTCYTAADGKQAVDLAKTVDPSVIILDVNMPFLDGFQVLTTIRSDPRTASVPVVMLTSVQQESDVVRGFSLGADDYIVKPFNPMELLARIRRLVKKES